MMCKTPFTLLKLNWQRKPVRVKSACFLKPQHSMASNTRIDPQSEKRPTQADRFISDWSICTTRDQATRRT
jgi:hypothetical protein